MNNLIQEYKGRKLFFDFYQDISTLQYVCRLWDITDLEKTDFSKEKELLKIEIVEYLKYQIPEDMTKYIVNEKYISSTDMLNISNPDVLLNLRNEMLKAIDEKY